MSLRFGIRQFGFGPNGRKQGVGGPSTLGFASNRNHLSEGTTTQQYYASRVVKRTGNAIVYGIRLAIPWWTVSSTTVVAAVGNAATIRASVEVAGVRYQLLQNGSADIVPVDGATILTDVLAITIPANTNVTVHANVNTGGAANKLPVMTTAWGGIGDGVETGGSATTDKTMTGTVSAVPAAGTTVFSPIVMGLMAPTTICHFLVGDSIMEGSEEDADMQVTNAADAYGNISWAEKLLGQAGYNFCNAGRGSTKASQWQTAGVMDKHVALMQMVTTQLYAVDALSQNDITGNIGTLKTYLGIINTNLKTGGADKVIGVTNKPWTDSTDSWATVVNQVDHVASAGKIATHNANIRSTPPTNQDSYCDLNAACRDASSELIWSAAGGAWTGDGIHFNPFGNALTVASMNVSSLL